jgi:hypothetical protein
LELTDNNKAIVDRFWLEYIEVETRINYLDMIVINMDKKNKHLKAFLALVTSGALAGLFFNLGCSKIWVGITFFAQIISILQPYFFDWEKQHWEAKSIIPLFRSLSKNITSDWERIIANKYTYDKIQELWQSYKEKRENIEHGISSINTHNEQLWIEAFEKTKLHLKNYYNLE